LQTLHVVEPPLTLDTVVGMTMGGTSLHGAGFVIEIGRENVASLDTVHGRHSAVATHGTGVAAGTKDLSLSVHEGSVAAKHPLVPAIVHNERVMSSPDSLNTLAMLAQRGDRRALSRFVETSQADVWRYCAYLTDTQTADDVTQDTYARAIGSLHRFRGDCDAKVWLLTIARRACADHIRSRTRRRNLMQRLQSGRHDEVAGPAHALELTQLVAVLDPDRRDAFVLTQVLGLGYHEAAEICGCPVGTIRSRVARARTDIIQAMSSGDQQSGTAG
jgi:RNA polymerase sigma-70 factor (ECF subfamily)